MRNFIWLAVIAVTGCTVPDKFLADPDGGGGTIDGGIDARVEPDGGVDTTAPETTIDTAPPEYSAEGLAAFAFSADEDATFVCGFDGETPVSCTSPYSRALSDGPHTFSVRATDLAGNQDDTPAEHVWSIDSVAPTTTITVAPAAIDNSINGMFAFSSNEANATFQCSLDGGAQTACTSPFSYGPLAKGAHTFAVRASDQAGNSDATPAMHSWSIDTSAPDTTIDSGPTGSVASTMATFTFSSPDAGGGETFECSLDGAAFTACTSPRSHGPLLETSHTFAVRVRDAGGNVDPSPATRTWTVDVTAPTTTITAAPSGPVSMTSASISFTSNEAGTFQCSLDGAAYAVCTSPRSLTSLTQGAHTFAVRAHDAAGNMDATPATASWTADTIAPDTTISSGPPSPDSSGNATFAMSSNETPVTYQCSLDTAAFAGCSSPFSIAVADGSHTMRIRATDAATNVDASPAMHTWTVDSTAPVVAITSGPTNGSTTGPYVTFAFTVDDPIATVSCSVNGGALTGCTSPVSYNLPAGLSSFRVEARDSFSRIGSAQRDWTIDCQPQTGGVGAIGLFHFDEPAGTQSAANSISGFAGATLGSSTSVELNDPAASALGRFATGFRFATTTDADVVNWSPGAVANTVEFTIEMWIKSEFADGLVQDYFRDGNSHVAIYQYPTVGVLRYSLQVQDDAGNNTYLTTAATSLGTWHHLVATFAGGTATLWLDGVSVSQSGIARTNAFAFGTSKIGTTASGNNTRATLDEVFFGNRVFTTTDVRSRYCPVSPVVAPTCPAAYQQITGQTHKYRPVGTSAFWKDAVTDCADDLPGWTYLAVPDNNAEMTQLAAFFGGPRWIGYSNQGLNPVMAWRTVLGDEPTYFNWDSGYPTAGGATPSVWFNGMGKWQNATGGVSNLAVCECVGQ